MLGMEQALELLGLTKVFGEQRAVDDLSLGVPSGSFFGAGLRSMTRTGVPRGAAALSFGGRAVRSVVETVSPATDATRTSIPRGPTTTPPSA